MKAIPAKLTAVIKASTNVKNWHRAYSINAQDKILRGGNFLPLLTLKRTFALLLRQQYVYKLSNRLNVVLSVTKYSAVVQWHLSSKPWFLKSKDFGNREVLRIIYPVSYVIIKNYSRVNWKTKTFFPNSTRIFFSQKFHFKNIIADRQEP